MPKIKNWKRYDKYPRTNQEAWENTETYARLYVYSSKYSIEGFRAGGSYSKWSVGDKFWRVTIFPSPRAIGEERTGVPLKQFDKKEKAMKYAINWMKKHPRG